MFSVKQAARQLQWAPQVPAEIPVPRVRKAPLVPLDHPVQLDLQVLMELPVHRAPRVPLAWLAKTVVMVCPVSLDPPVLRVSPEWLVNPVQRVPLVVRATRDLLEKRVMLASTVWLDPQDRLVHLVLQAQWVQSVKWAQLDTKVQSVHAARLEPTAALVFPDLRVPWDPQALPVSPVKLDRRASVVKPVREGLVGNVEPLVLLEVPDLLVNLDPWVNQV